MSQSLSALSSPKRHFSVNFPIDGVLGVVLHPPPPHYAFFLEAERLMVNIFTAPSSKISVSSGAVVSKRRRGLRSGAGVSRA